jgi:hypothetical protein
MNAQQREAIRMKWLCKIGIHRMAERQVEVARTRYVVMSVDERYCERCGKLDRDYQLIDWARREAARMEQESSVSLISWTPPRIAP